MAGIDYARRSGPGCAIVEEPYPNGVKARAVYRGDDAGSTTVRTRGRS